MGCKETGWCPVPVPGPHGTLACPNLSNRSPDRKVRRMTVGTAVLTHHRNKREIFMNR